MLTTEIIQLLPVFNGKDSEDPIMHLGEFHNICMSMKPSNILEGDMKIRCFPHTLKGDANDWLYYLPKGEIDSWEKLHKAFLENYFPIRKIENMRQQIARIQQYDHEPLFTYEERFRRLCLACPFHGYAIHNLVEYLMNGMQKKTLNESTPHPAEAF